MMADEELIVHLRGGDERAFIQLVGRYQRTMVRLARSFVPNSMIAEEVVQETWLGVLRGIGRFEGRTSLKAWMFQILVNRARTMGVREHRSVPIDTTADTVDDSRFDDSGRWLVPPQHWSDRALDRLFAAKVAGRIHAAIDELPPAQRQVVTLRDVEGLAGSVICELLDITDANQRVLLHRGRVRIREILEAEFGEVWS